MGDSKNFSADHHNAVRREMKAKQKVHTRAHHNDDHEEREQFECDFQGKFTPETLERFAGIQAEQGCVCAGHLYQMVQDDMNHVVLELTGPESAVDALNACGMKVVVRPLAFRTFETVKRENEAGEWVPEQISSRMPFKCRSVIVPTAGGFGIKFKYNALRGCIIVC